MGVRAKGRTARERARMERTARARARMQRAKAKGAKARLRRKQRQKTWARSSRVRAKSRLSKILMMMSRRALSINTYTHCMYAREALYRVGTCRLHRQLAIR